MHFTSKVLEDLVAAFATLPSIGKKSALRLALHLVREDRGKALRISNALSELAHKIQFCRRCHSISDDELCNICSSHSRNHSIICVVETIRDVMAIEETGQFNGVYHVLGGVISPMEGIGPEDVHIRSLVERVRNESVDELIMAISPTIEGDTTIYYITRQLSGMHVKISTIARGVAFGGDLEYTDELTLGRSILARTPVEIPN
ncbi:MAG TPA: recombination mediator RecR [Saprospiraceae bacterium]|nr:recombination mediator RecR [Saprospiraceae bacterium]